MEDAWPQISIIIPARNEENRILPLLKSLKQQTMPIHEIIVVDDHSYDATIAVSLREGATVVESKVLPAGWSGKPFACWQGALHSSGKILLFLDADTFLEPKGLERIVRAYLQKGGLLTVQPYHVTYKAYEQLSAFFNIVQMAGINAFTPLGEGIRPSASFGPCIICNRGDYFSLGGHQKVRGQVLEDIGLARLFLSHHQPVTAYGGRGAISFRMYPGGIQELIEGWSKGISIGAFSSRPLFLLMCVTWISGCLSACYDLLRSLFKPGSSKTLRLQIPIYIAYALQVRWMLKGVGRFHLWTSLFFPLPLIFFAVVMLRSVIMVYIMGRVGWKERVISTTRRKFG